MEPLGREGGADGRPGRGQLAGVGGSYLHMISIISTLYLHIVSIISMSQVRVCGGGAVRDARHPGPGPDLECGPHSQVLQIEDIFIFKQYL